MLLLYISGQWLLYQSSHPESTIEVIRPTKLTTTVNDEKSQIQFMMMRKEESGIIVTSSWRPFKCLDSFSPFGLSNYVTHVDNQ